MESQVVFQPEAQANILSIESSPSFVHAGFVFFAGVVHASSGDLSFFPGWLAVLNSVLNAAELVALLAFFMELRGKVHFLVFQYTASCL